MHFCVNGVEHNVTVTSGTQNPSGAIQQVTGIVFGHDSITTLDNVRILNEAIGAGTAIWQEFWFWAAVAAAFTILLVGTYYVSKHGTKTKATDA